MRKQRGNGQTELVLRGIGVSPGVVCGPVYLISTEETTYAEKTLSEAEIPVEIRRFESAVIETRRQINAIQKNVQRAIGQYDANIFDVHKMVLDDGAFVEEAIRKIRTDRCNAETVVRGVVARYAEALSIVEDDYLRERVADVKDVARRVLRNLSGEKTHVLDGLRDRSIVVSGDLAPSETASLRKDLVMGFATDLGSTTSHTAIMARALGIPAVVGLGNVTARLKAGDTVLMDGTEGVVIVHPSEKSLRKYGKLAEVRQAIRTGLNHLKDEPATTRDGHRVTLSANIFMPEGDGPFPAILVLHTSGQVMRGDLDYAKRLAKNGYAALIPHYFYAHNISWQARGSVLTEHAEEILNDFVGCVEYLQKNPKIDKDRIGAVGFSMGGYWAMVLAAKGIVQAGVSNYGVLSGVGGNFNQQKYQFRAIFNRQSSPVLIMHGAKDATQRVDGALRLSEGLDRTQIPHETQIYPNADHEYDRGPAYDSAEAKDSWNRAIAFFGKYLAKRDPS